MKQETLEEAGERYNLNTINAFGDYQSFIDGAKWQQERSYSEEEVLKLLKSRTLNLYINIPTDKHLGTEKWFEKIKKK